MVPNLIGSEPVRLLYAPPEESHSPRSASDMIHLPNMLPRDPWSDLAAGTGLKIVRDKSGLVFTFEVATKDLTWPGLELAESFAIAMVQRIDRTMTAYVAHAVFKRVELDYALDHSVWAGLLSLGISYQRELEEESLSEALAAVAS